MNVAATDVQIDRFPAALERPSRVPHSRKELRIHSCVAYMEQNLHLPLQVEALRAMLNVSTSHFFYLFKQATGRSPIDCLIRLRMRKACELLDETQLSIKEISASLGYKEQFYFSRVFKAVVGLAPTHFRALDRVQRRMLENNLFRNPISAQDLHFR